MYFAYGFPQSLVTGEIGPDERFVKAIPTDDHVLLIYSDRIQAWSAGQHRIRLGEVVVDDRDRRAEGSYTAGTWTQSRRRLALLTDKSYLHIYGVSTSKEVLWQSKGGPAAKQTNVYIQQSCHIDLEPGDQPVAVLSDQKTILVVTSAGVLLGFDWNGREKTAPSASLLTSDPISAIPVENGEDERDAEIESAVDNQADNYYDANNNESNPALIVPTCRVISVAYAPMLGFLILILDDGRAWLIQLSEEVLSAVDQAAAVGLITDGGATCASFDPVNSTLAVGRTDGNILVYDAATLLSARPDTPLPATQLFSQSEWGIDPEEVLGGVACLAWSGDGCVLAVGHRKAGLAVWTASGCRTLSTTGRSLQHQEEEHVSSTTTDPLESPVSGLAWSTCGYRLLVAAEADPGELIELRFAHSVRGDTRTPLRPRWGPGQDLFDPATSGELPPWLAAPGVDSHFLLGAEDVLLVQPKMSSLSGLRALAPQGSTKPELNLQYLRPPQAYIDVAYPLTHASMDLATGDIAVAGSAGLAVWLSGSAQWRLMGDAAQERSTHSAALVWLPGGIVGNIVSAVGRRYPEASPPGPFKLVLYPKTHLDQSSAIASLDLGSAPITGADALGDSILIASGAVEFRLVRFDHGGGGGKPRLSLARHLNLLDSVSPLQEIALVDPRLRIENEVTDNEEAADSSNVAIQDAAGEPAGQMEKEGDNSTGDKAAIQSETTDAQALPVLRLKLPIPRSEGKSSSSRSHHHKLRRSHRLRFRTNLLSEQPSQAVLRRQDGSLSLLDLDLGSEKHLARGVERYWLPAIISEAGGLAGEVRQALSSSADAAASHSRSSSMGEAQLELRRQRTGFTHSRTTSDADLLPIGLPATTSGAIWSIPRQASNPITSSCAATSATTTASNSLSLPDAEFPWWVYGATGMRLVFPSVLLAGGSGDATPGPGWAIGTPASVQGSLHNNYSATPANSTGRRSPELEPVEPELAFDAGVYPLGISLHDLSVIGLAQRAVRAPPGVVEGGHQKTATCLPACLHPLPGSQPVLPCLLRRLIAAGHDEEALDLARWYASVPHFNRSAEWLLFTALENDERDREARTEIQRRSTDVSVSSLGRAEEQEGSMYNGVSTTAIGSQQHRATEESTTVLLSARGGRSRCGPALRSTVSLLSAFPRSYGRTIISVARKTDAALWPALFAAVGSPYRLTLRLLSEDAVDVAAAALLVVNHVEGPGTARNAAVAVARSALERYQYPLAVEAIRFLTPPGEERLLPAVGLVGRRGTEEILAAQREASSSTGDDTNSTPGLLGSWFRSWWNSSSTTATSDDNGSTTLLGITGQAPEGSNIHTSTQSNTRKHSRDTTEALDSLTPLVDIWSLLSAHAWSLLGPPTTGLKPGPESLARLARFAEALRTLPGTELRELLVAGARENGLEADVGIVDDVLAAVESISHSTLPS